MLIEIGGSSFFSNVRKGVQKLPAPILNKSDPLFYPMSNDSVLNIRLQIVV
jgi:hypothetical protein